MRDDMSHEAKKMEISISNKVWQITNLFKSREHFNCDRSLLIKDFLSKNKSDGISEIDLLIAATFSLTAEIHRYNENLLWCNEQLNGKGKVKDDQS